MKLKGAIAAHFWASADNRSEIHLTRKHVETSTSSSHTKYELQIKCGETKQSTTGETRRKITLGAPANAGYRKSVNSN